MRTNQPFFFFFLIYAKHGSHRQNIFSGSLEFFVVISMKKKSTSLSFCNKKTQRKTSACRKEIVNNLAGAEFVQSKEASPL